MIPEQELRQMYLVQGMSISEITSKTSVPRSTVNYQMKQYGIESRMISEAKLKGSQRPSEEKLEKMYWEQGMSHTEIANEIGASRSIVYNCMKLYGIKTRTTSEAQLNGIQKPSKEKLHDMYLVQGMSQLEIAKKIGVSLSTVNNWIKQYNINSRTRSEGLLNGNFTGERSGGWRGGISGGKYCYKFNNKFKEAVRERDNYTCQLCGSEQNGRKLDVHHIHYDKSDCWPDVVALCRSCHIKANGNRNYWEQYFEDQLSGRGLTCWSIIQET